MLVYHRKETHETSLTSLASDHSCYISQIFFLVYNYFFKSDTICVCFTGLCKHQWGNWVIRVIILVWFSFLCVPGDGMNAYMAYKVTTKVRLLYNIFI